MNRKIIYFINPVSGTKQKTLLEQEGIEFKVNNCIDLKKYRWQPPLDLMDE